MWYIINCDKLIQIQLKLNLAFILKKGRGLDGISENIRL